MQTIETGAGRIHYLDTGPRDGRALLFSNSLGTDFRVWDGILPHLPDDLRIVRYDKRGHGLSDCPAGPYTMDELVDDAETLTATLGLDRLTIVGLSIGGMIGQGFAARRPDLVRALVLMDTAARIGTPGMWRDRIDAIGASGLEAAAGPILERWFTKRFRESPDVAPWRNMLTRTPLDGYLGCAAAIADADLTESTSKLSLPVMALAGEADGSTPPDVVQATADLCGGTFHIVRDAGHLPCVEQPEITAAHLRAFLDETE